MWVKKHRRPTEDKMRMSPWSFDRFQYIYVYIHILDPHPLELSLGDGFNIVYKVASPLGAFLKAK